MNSIRSRTASHLLSAGIKPSGLAAMRCTASFRKTLRWCSGEWASNPSSPACFLSTTAARFAAKPPSSYNFTNQLPSEVEGAAPSLLDGRRKCLLFRSKERGMLENDLILGTFALKYLATMSETELKLFEALLEESDPDLWQWITKKMDLPERLDHDLMRRIQTHAQSNPLEYKKAAMAEELPLELVCSILALVEPEFAAVAARTCKRWYACTLAEKRNKLDARVARSGLSLFRWALENGCPYTPRLCRLAAKDGQLDVLQWVQEQGWSLPADTCSLAANKGHYHLVKWAFSVGCPLKASVCSAAAARGDMETLRWAREHDCPWSVWTCALAARDGRLAALQWCHEQGCPWDERTCQFAAMNGHLAILQWAREKGCPWDQHTCHVAALRGHLTVLQWARQAGCPWGKKTCANAAQGGHLAILQWARENGCPWDDRTCTNAAEGGHLEVLQWAREQGCPWDSWTCLGAGWMGHLAVLKWLRANGCPWDESVGNVAAKHGREEVAQWARDGYPL
ncbi:Ankyrin repeat-containing domain [Balamuthia mandrillaris]